ncbi:hypothetical protein ES703_96170 [subsurface metagenome]
MGVDLGFGEQQFTWQRIEFAIVEHQAHLHRMGRDAIELAGIERAAQLVHLVHRLREVGIDRVKLLDGRKARRIVLHDQRALADIGRTDDAVDRRSDGGVVKIEGGNVGFRLAHDGYGLFVLCLRRRPLLEQRTDTVSLRGGLFEHGLGARERRLGRLHLDVERTRIDSIEGIAGLHLAALGEQALDDDAGHARANLGDAGRRDAARQLAHLGARPRLHDEDADIDFGGARRGGCRRLLASGKQRSHRRKHQCNAG